MDKKTSSPFIFEEVKTPIGKKTMIDNENTFLLANTKPSSNLHLPFPKDYKFESCFLSTSFEDFANDYRTFKVRSDDVWILGYPKSGTTWTLNIVSQLKNGFDFSKEPLAIYTGLFLERFTVNPEDGYKDLELLNKAPSPRVIQSHLPPHLLPVELWTVRPKIIYMARNPKDVAVSFFHMSRDALKYYSGTIEEQFDIFLENRSLYAPLHAHILAYWQLRNLDHLLFLNYEEQLADRFAAVKKIAKFLECTYGEEELKELMEYTSIENMRKLYTKPMNGFQFFRKGKAGGFVDEMSEEYIKKFDEWTAENLKYSDFKFAI
ncbi:sulfotransferase 1 family member D1-like [Contarinia nasturtii]|uniref:sulfotransferase 1 family member D1-like n=1 Tax=Contarinia nasturtii TaxID=265458 RepID=UPI0012D3F2CD|nr:sulfotransferase 1 family member D1-like [Contarinia nasturtii]